VSRRLWVVLALALTGCPSKEEPPGEPNLLCEGLQPLRLSVLPDRARVGTAVELIATGGSGYYQFSALPGATGEVRGDRYITGATPGAESLQVEDAACAGVDAASASLGVVAAFEVKPARAVLLPAVTFQISVAGMLGGAAFQLLSSGSSGTLTPEGRYTAGAQPGLDLISVRDSATGDEALLQFQVSPTALFRASPPRWAAPAGSSLTLATADGTDSVRWTKLSGPGTLTAARLELEAGARGTVELEALDPFTGLKTRAFVRVLDELTRTTAAHGRLTDLGATASADFDGDGIDDLALGVPESDLSRPQGGAVFVFKGSAEGLPAQPTWTLTGSSDTGQLGAVLAAGDLDGDGRAELAVSSPGADITIGDSGALFLYRFGAQGPTPLRDALTGVGRGNFAAAMAIADLDGDGDHDLVVGSPGADLAPTAALQRRGVLDLFLLEKGALIPEQGAVRLGGRDLNTDGTLANRTDTRLGRAVAAGDLNGDSRVDLAAVVTVNNSLVGGTAVLARPQQAVAVHFARAAGFESAPDLYVIPANSNDTNEGNYRLAVIPAVGDRPSLLMVVAEQSDSPDLSASGGTKSGSNSGGALFFDLNAHQPSGAPGEKPVQVGREQAYLRVYGDTAGIFAGRSFALVDLDGVAGPELVLGAPYAAVSINGTSQSNVGRLLVYPLQGHAAGAVINKPIDSASGTARMDTLGAALASWKLPAGEGLVALAGRASTALGTFTGRIDALERRSGALPTWARRSAPVPARAAGELFGTAVAVARGVSGKIVVAVGAPGFAGPGASNDGNDLGAGRALLFNHDAPGTAVVAAEGAASPLSRGGRAVGQDVTFTDFDGDGRQDLVVAMPNLQAPGANVRTTEITPVYETERAACVPATSQTLGGFLISAGQADGTFKPAFKLWAPDAIPGCTPVGGTACRRSGIGRGVIGGFDFDGDGKQDVAALRNNGFELFLGRAPDGSGAKLSMGCDPVYSAPYSAQPTSAPTALGDLDADGCDELAWRYADGTRAGVVVLFGHDPGGVRCGGKALPTRVRIAGDGEVGLSFLGLGVSIANAGNFVGDGIARLAISATAFPVDGRPQPSVVLYEIPALVARRPVTGDALVAAIGDGLVPRALAQPERPPSYGRALAGNVDLDGDGKHELVVGAPGASLASEGGGAVYIYRGGTLTGTVAQPLLVVPGDVRERGAIGQALGMTRGAGPAALVMGAPASYRVGTLHGTAFLLPLGF
jgi:hypothetical protein